MSAKTLDAVRRSRDGAGAMRTEAKDYTDVTIATSNKPKRKTTKKSAPPIDDVPPIDDRPDGDDGGRDDDDRDELLSWPDTAEIRHTLTRNRQSLRPGDKLPLRELHVRGQAPPDCGKLEKRLAKHRADVTELASEYDGCVCQYPATKFLETRVEELQADRAVKLQGLLHALQCAFRLAGEGAKLAGELATAWIAHGDVVRGREDAVRESTKELLREVYPDDHDMAFKGKVNSSPAMVAFRQEASATTNASSAGHQERHRLTELRTAIALEIELLCESIG